MTLRVDLLLIASIATAAICVQNWMSVLAFAWAAIHAAGLEALLAFLPAAIGIALVWAGYIFLSSRKEGWRTPVLFGAYALGILILNEVVLPATPLKAWRTQRALEAVEVLTVRDEVLLSARGNPIGVRIIFAVVFPRRVVGRVRQSTSTIGPVEGPLPYPLQLRGHSRQVEPSPTSQDSDEVYQGGVVYTVTTTSLPNFLWYDESTQETCLQTVTSESFSEADFLSALSENRSIKLHVFAVLDSDYSTTAVYRRLGPSRDYDLEAMYETIVMEGNKRCQR